MESQTKRPAAAPPAATAELPFSLPLELTVHDPDTIAELLLVPEGEPRDQYALKALRIGVLALRQARGQIDAAQVRRESERLLESLKHELGTYSSTLHDRLTGTLKEYFDPDNGRFPERVERLVKKDGELEALLRRQIGDDESELTRTLTAHVGQESPLMKMLAPDETKGLMAALRATLEEQLRAQREQVLAEFSLDNKDGALSRFIVEVTDHQGKLSEKLHGKIDEVVKEFSLDEEESALSRLVRNVERAQRTITSEFSLDDETSALSRLKSMLETTNQAIHSHLSLDNEESALARLKRELLKLLGEQGEANRKFREEVTQTLQIMAARREEAQRSTRHGLDFEDAVFRLIQAESQKKGDIATRTGNTTGRIKNCKVGDCLVQLGPESAAAGARLVVEAKQKAGYDLAQAQKEIETARKNRDAQVGIFVFSQGIAPDGLAPLERYGSDVVVVWDADRPESDLYLCAALTLARALCVRAQNDQSTHAAELSAIDAAILEIEKQTTALGEIETWSQTIHSNSEKILKRVSRARKSLQQQTQSLSETMDQLRGVFEAGADGPP